MNIVVRPVKIEYKMPPKNGMTRTLYRGIPVWVNDAQDMFIYGIQEPFVKIGTSSGLIHNWREVYSPILTSFRSSMEPRSRAKKI